MIFKTTQIRRLHLEDDAGLIRNFGDAGYGRHRLDGEEHTALIFRVCQHQGENQQSATLEGHRVYLLRESSTDINY
jgi:hypothetical protein